jgi:hypothetical protein
MIRQDYMQHGTVLAAAGLISAVLLSQPAHAASANCPDTTLIKRHYHNFTYGFDLLIPKGLTARWNSAACSIDAKLGCVCMGDHGRDIPLDGGGQIGVFASWVDPDYTLATALVADIQSFRQLVDASESSVFSVTELQPWKVRNLPAYKYVAKSVHGDEVIVREALLAIRKQSAVQVLIYIQAPEAQYLKYRPAFKPICQSWHE